MKKIKQKITNYLNKPVTTWFKFQWSLIIIIFVIGVIYSIHYLIAKPAVAHRIVQICGSCQPIPIPPKAYSVDTIRGRQNYLKIFAFKNGILTCNSTLGDKYLFFNTPDSLLISRLTSDFKEISDLRAKSFKTARKAGLPIDQMAPYPEFIYLKVASFNSKNLTALNFSFLKHVQFGNEYQPQVKIKNLDIQLSGKSIEFENFRLLGKVSLKRTVNYLQGNVDVLSFRNGTFEKFNSEIVCTTLKIHQVTIDSNATITLGNYNELYDIAGNGTLELQTNNTSDTNLLQVILRNIDLDHLKFPYYGINFIVDTSISQPYPTKLRLFQQLINHYSDIPEQKMKYDVQRIELINKQEKRVFLGCLSKHWNYYGYNKNLIFKNSVAIMLFFYFLNLFLFKKLLFNGYEIREIQLAYERYINSNRLRIIKVAGYAFYTFIYTTFIFWGLNLRLDKIRLSNKGLFGIVIIQYLTGLICLAYIANVIITK